MDRPFEKTQRSFNRTALEDQTILSGRFWGELRVFLAVAKAKSFNKAAVALNTSQPTVSRQVKRLQDLMGAQLVIPTTHGVELTARGKELAYSLSHLDQTLFSLCQQLSEEKTEIAGLVRISITDGLNALFLAPSLMRFSKQNPHIQLVLKSPANLTDLRETQTDVMLGFSPQQGADLSVRQLGYLHFIPIASRNYIDRNGLPTKANLETHLFVQSEFYSAQSAIWHGWQQAISRGRIAHYCDNSFAYGMLVKAGLGIGLLGSYAVIEPDAVPLEIGVTATVPMFAVALTERLESKPVRVFYEWISDLFSSKNPWFKENIELSNNPSEYDAGFRMLFNI